MRSSEQKEEMKKVSEKTVKKRSKEEEDAEPDEVRLTHRQTETHKQEDWKELDASC